MPLNPVFNSWSAANEQNLYQNLIIESIQMYGIELTYIPRELNNLDEIWVEDAVSTYTNTYQIEGYVKNVMGYSGDGTFMSMFGVEIRDQVTFTIARPRWEEDMSSIRERPWEGDVIYLPQFGKRFFRILNVTNGAEFFQLGKLYVYDLVCESMENSSEEFDTSNNEIDDLVGSFSLADVASYDVPYDGSAINQELDDVANTVIDFSVTNPFGGY